LKSGAADGATEDDDGETPASATARRRRKDRVVAEQLAAEQRDTLKHERTEIEMDMTEVLKVAQGATTRFCKADFFREIDRRALAQKRDGETREQAFSRFASTPDGLTLMAAHKRASGPDFEFERPVTKDDCVAPTPSLDKLKALAADRQKTTGVTPESAFAAVYTDPANKDLVAQHKAELAEQSAIDAARKWPGVAQTFRPAGAQEHTARVS